MHKLQQLLKQQQAKERHLEEQLHRQKTLDNADIARRVRENLLRQQQYQEAVNDENNMMHVPVLPTPYNSAINNPADDNGRFTLRNLTNQLFPGPDLPIRQQSAADQDGPRQNTGAVDFKDPSQRNIFQNMRDPDTMARDPNADVRDPAPSRRRDPDNLSPRQRFQTALKDNDMEYPPANQQELIRFILINNVLKPSDMIMKFMNLGLTVDGMRSIFPIQMSKYRMDQIEFESYSALQQEEKRAKEKEVQKSLDPKSATDMLKLGQNWIQRPFKCSLHPDTLFDMHDNLHPVMFYRAPTTNPQILWKKCAQDARDHPPMAIKSYTMDHLNDINLIPDKTWVAVHDMRILDFSVQHFGGPALTALLKNCVPKTGIDEDPFQEITGLADFHVAFNKMKSACHRAYPLDYSYESITGFLGYNNYFEGMAHYQDRQGIPPGVLCVKLVDLIAMENRRSFTKDGDFDNFLTMKDLIRGKQDMLEKIYQLMGITPKVLANPGSKNAARGGRGGQSSRGGSGGNGGTTPGRGGRGGQSSRGGKSGAKGRPFEEWGHLCRDFNKGTCSTMNQRVCLTATGTFLHGCDVKKADGRLCRKFHRSCDHVKEEDKSAT